MTGALALYRTLPFVKSSFWFNVSKGGFACVAICRKSVTLWEPMTSHMRTTKQIDGSRLPLKWKNLWADALVHKCILMQCTEAYWGHDAWTETQKESVCRWKWKRTSRPQLRCYTILARSKQRLQLKSLSQFQQQLCLQTLGTIPPIMMATCAMGNTWPSCPDLCRATVERHYVVTINKSLPSHLGAELQTFRTDVYETWMKHTCYAGEHPASPPAVQEGVGTGCRSAGAAGALRWRCDLQWQSSICWPHRYHWRLRSYSNIHTVHLWEKRSGLHVRITVGPRPITPPAPLHFTLHITAQAVKLQRPSLHMLPRISSSNQNLNEQEVLRPTGLRWRHMGEVVTSLSFLPPGCSTNNCTKLIQTGISIYIILRWDCVLDAAFQFSTIPLPFSYWASASFSQFKPKCRVTFCPPSSKSRPKEGAKRSRTARCTGTFLFPASKLGLSILICQNSSLAAYKFLIPLSFRRCRDRVEYPWMGEIPPLTPDKVRAVHLHEKGSICRISVKQKV